MKHRARFFLPSLAACAVLFACAVVFPGANIRRQKTVPFEVIERGNDSAFADRGPVLELLPDEGSLDAFYTALHMNRIPATAPPRVDFDSELVLYISFGRKQTGGYSVKVLNARIIRRALVVKAQLKKPLPDIYLTQMITNPYVLVAVPRSGTSGLEYDRVELHDSNGDLLFAQTYRSG